MPVAVRLEHVAKRYGGHLAVDDFSLEIEEGRFVTLLGPSGSGKTTLLMMLAGFTQPTAGKIFAGTHVKMDKVSVRRARVVEAEPIDPGAIVELDIDGEAPGVLPARFEIVPGALSMIVPGGP